MACLLLRIDRAMNPRFKDYIGVERHRSKQTLKHTPFIFETGSGLRILNGCIEKAMICYT